MSTSSPAPRFYRLRSDPYLRGRGSVVRVDDTSAIFYREDGSRCHLRKGEDAPTLEDSELFVRLGHWIPITEEEFSALVDAP